MPTYTHRFSVSGKYPFPVDMLRYDGAHPASERDSSKVTSAIKADTREDVSLSYMIELVVVNAHKYWRPTTGRWYSFGWSPGQTETTKQEV